MAGRKRKPTALKLLQGTFQPCRANPDEPQPEIGAPDMPKYLKGEARAEWDRVVEYLSRTRVIAKGEGAMLAVYCVLYAKFIEATRRGGEVTGSMIAQLRALASEFGLTPASRGHVHSTKPQEKENEWQSLAAKK